MSREKLKRSAVLLDDPSPADHLVAVVKDGGLAGRHGSLRLVEGGDDLTRIAGRFQRCPSGS